MTVLDIGAGVGAVHLSLLESGASARRRRRRVVRRLSRRPATRPRGAAWSTGFGYEVGDFVALAPSVEAADVVALDRVVCCYRRHGVARVRCRPPERSGDTASSTRATVAWIRVGARVANAFSRAGPLQGPHPRPSYRRCRRAGPGRRASRRPPGGRTCSGRWWSTSARPEALALAQSRPMSLAAAYCRLQPRLTRLDGAGRRVRRTLN